MEMNPNFTYMLQSAKAEDNVYHKNNSAHSFVCILISLICIICHSS
jgi:hypothetical protein